MSTAAAAIARTTAAPAPAKQEAPRRSPLSAETPESEEEEEEDEEDKPAKQQQQQQQQQKQRPAPPTGTRLIPVQLPAGGPARRALDRRGLRAGVPQHMRAALSSPTDRIQSPASRAVNSLRHKTHTGALPAPQVLGSLFEAMKPADRK
ncbi:hypothetical protein H4R18_003299 [Coemansia javaensis]|uniref:Uncharacterized protein n=1 Tax=Coemansia javaensis TaxID=2761396 RepID=A0A9W8H8C8_9FUNG|nr:hypothetical protein H4R18_003299 [Coemansia javaensis]